MLRIDRFAELAVPTLALLATAAYGQIKEWLSPHYSAKRYYADADPHVARGWVGRYECAFLIGFHEKTDSGRWVCTRIEGREGSARHASIRTLIGSRSIRCNMGSDQRGCCNLETGLHADPREAGSTLSQRIFRSHPDWAVRPHPLHL